MKSAIELKNVSYGFASTTTLFSGLNLQIAEGEAVGILGDNGSGKSTLLRIFATLLKPASGTLFIEGLEAKSNLKTVRTGINFSAGAPLGFYPRLSGTENLIFFSALKGEMIGQREAETLMKLVELPEDSFHKKYHQYSLGMKQRLHMARLCLKPCRLLLLDEPTNGLSPSGVETLVQLLNVNLKGVTKVIVSHDEAFRIRVSSRQLHLSVGAIDG